MEKKFNSIEHEVIYNKMLETLKNDEQYTEAVKELSEKYTSISINDGSISDEWNQYIRGMESTKNNHAHRYLHSHRKVLGPFIVFSKKVVRKLLKWYINPITEQQTSFNNIATSAIVKTSEQLTRFKNDLDNVNIKYSNSEGVLQDTIKSIITLVDEKYLMVEKKIQELQDVISLSNSNSEVKFQELKKEQYELKQDHQEIQEQYQELLSKVLKVEHSNSVLLERIDLNLSTSDSFFEKKTYGQSGEDSILAYIILVLGIPFEQITYLDLGANHAKELSNTYYFYNKGAKGILVEANPKLIFELKLYRGRDIILNNVIDVEDNKEVDFYILSGDGLSTPDYDAAISFCEINPDITIEDKKTVKTITYKTIVEQYLGEAPTILSVDIEGKDFEILQSIDFENYRPLLIVIEMISYDTKLNYTTKSKEIMEFLESNNYDEYAFTGINSIFIDKEFLNQRS